MRATAGRVTSASHALTVAAFGGLITFGCVLRFWKLSDVGLWYDELWTVVGAGRPFMEMYREWMLGDSHPPGYFLFYFAWLRIVPDTEFWSRLPNAIVGVATVAYLLFCTGRVLTRNERIMSAAFASLLHRHLLRALGETLELSSGTWSSALIAAMSTSGSMRLLPEPSGAGPFQRTELMMPLSGLSSSAMA